MSLANNNSFAIYLGFHSTKKIKKESLDGQTAKEGKHVYTIAIAI